MDILTLALARAFTKKTVIGLGALKGAPCTIKTISLLKNAEDVVIGHRVTFEWTANNGTIQTQVLDIMNGEDGKDGATPSINADGYWVIGTHNTGVKALGVKGDTGVSVVSFVKTSTAGLVDTYTMTLSDGTEFTVPITNGSNITKLSELENDTGFITSTAENLVNYFLKSETYNKDDIDELLRNVGAGLGTQIVEELPTSEISATTIYLIKQSEITTSTDYIYVDGSWILKEGSGIDTTGWEVVNVTSLPVTGIVSNSIYRLNITKTVYAQYMYISGKWANLGSTDVDLSNYYTRTQMDNKLNGYVLLTYLATTLEEYAKKETLGAVAFSNNYNDLDNLPEIPDMDTMETKAHAETTYETKADAATFAENTLSTMENMSIAIANNTIRVFSDRNAYNEFAQTEEYSTDRFYAFFEKDGLVLIRSGKEVSGETVEQSYDPTSVKPISGVGVAEAVPFKQDTIQLTVTTSNTLLNIINSTGKTFGSCGVKATDAVDLPASGEWTILWFGSLSRISVIAKMYAHSSNKTYIRDIFSESWQTDWTALN